MHDEVFSHVSKMAKYVRICGRCAVDICCVVKIRTEKYLVESKLLSDWAVRSKAHLKCLNTNELTCGVTLPPFTWYPLLVCVCVASTSKLTQPKRKRNRMRTWKCRQKRWSLKWKKNRKHTEKKRNQIFDRSRRGNVAAKSFILSLTLSISFPFWILQTNVSTYLSLKCDSKKENIRKTKNFLPTSASTQLHTVVRFCASVHGRRYELVAKRNTTAHRWALSTTNEDTGWECDDTSVLRLLVVRLVEMRHRQHCCSEELGMAATCKCDRRQQYWNRKMENKWSAVRCLCVFHCLHSLARYNVCADERLYCTRKTNFYRSKFHLVAFANQR